MLDGQMRKWIDPPLNFVGRQLARAGITANGVTLAGLLIGLISAVTVAMGYFYAGLILMLLSRVMDGLDGAVARATQKTDFGGYFDITADFLFYGAFPLAFIIFDPAQNGVWGAVLLVSFYFNGGTFLGYAILAEKHKLTTTKRGAKSLYFSTGLTEGTETIAFFAALCIWPQYFNVLAGLFAAAVFYTAIARMLLAYQEYGNKITE
ncbi:CDP-diacylglycerol--glycerol-3-phosphate 3-phosphatidyltransferase [Maritalea myrionectae]|uniref:CDP-diacylglycerol--glycerol-3-phosphate 3-phosphatidyltransferase n=1 Tax=Maritalea myrionectae TaxID=454601 RepID=A0A2R4MHY5_9HYPH|nr:CDP-alcohol phosphatidyltransferase family protein [Maritalea myrionectae]AVX05509.1 CDP-diacylglycerol--glycerol-3-phosphate 3-phosphatidyltransferase [Maritalea myrionectae]